MEMWLLLRYLGELECDDACVAVGLRLGDCYIFCSDDLAYLAGLVFQDVFLGMAVAAAEVSTLWETLEDLLRGSSLYLLTHIDYKKIQGRQAYSETILQC
jgi:hypothetical protein